MHEELTVGPWKIRCDPDTTRAAYQQIAKGGADECTCNGCRNFVAIRSSAYPAEVRRLFDQLGIDVSKEVEVYEMGHDVSGHLYGGWLHFIGSVDESPATTAEGTPFGPFLYLGGMLTALRPESDAIFRFYFHNKSTLLDTAFKGHTVAQFEFEAALPWVLEEPEP